MFEGTCQRVQLVALRLRAAISGDTIVRTELRRFSEQRAAQQQLASPTDAPKRVRLTPLNPVGSGGSEWQSALYSFTPAQDSSESPVSRTDVVRAGRVSLRPVRECGVDTPASELRRD